MGLSTWAKGGAAAALTAALGSTILGSTIIIVTVLGAAAQPLRAATLVLGGAPGENSPLPLAPPALPSAPPARGDITLADSMIAQAVIPAPLATATPASGRIAAPLPVTAIPIPPSLPDRQIWPAPLSPARPIPPSLPRQVSYSVAGPAPQAQVSVPEGNVAWGLGAIALALYCRHCWSRSE